MKDKRRDSKFNDTSVVEMTRLGLIVWQVRFGKYLTARFRWSRTVNRAHMIFIPDSKIQARTYIHDPDSAYPVGSSFSWWVDLKEQNCEISGQELLEAILLGGLEERE